MRGIKPSKDTHFINSEWEASQLLPSLEEKLQREPQNWRVMINLGNAYYTLGDIEKSLQLFEQAYVLEPNNAVVCSNLGIALGEQVRFAEALPYVKKANEIDPTDRYAASVYAEFMLRTGQWKMGWDLYEKCRFSLPECPLPKYVGGPLHGARLLVLQEGGAGDAFMFFRFFENLRMLKPKSITFAADVRLHCIFENHPWIDTLLANHDTKIKLADYDCWVSSFSLGAIFAQTVDSLSWSGSYLAAEKKVHGIIGGTPKVGLCWMAGEESENRRHRTLSPLNISRLVENTDVRWYSLQYDCQAPVGVESLDLSTWEKTAEEIDALDLVISVDTGVAHLAGAIGKPVWTLLSNSCWRFLLGRAQSVWYPSMTLFRNHSSGYDTAVENVGKQLQRFELLAGV